jgi:shikimate dehydrogenase
MTERLYVVGNPVAHSLSPLIHNTWLKRYGIDAEYGRILAGAEALPGLVADVREGRIKGLNVTVPHKQAVLPYMDALTEAARAVGAVNTIYREGGRAIGDNTDAYGFYANPEHALPGFSGSGKTACVIGAGGAARAAVAALVERGFASVTVANRSPDKADALAKDFGPRVLSVPMEALARFPKPPHLLVNATSLGMEGQPPLDIPYDALIGGETVVYDIVYKPLMTPLLLEAARRGAPVVTGIGMLERQAAKAFERWFGVLPARDAGLDALLLKG